LPDIFELPLEGATTGTEQLERVAAAGRILSPAQGVYVIDDFVTNLLATAVGRWGGWLGLVDG
jgi:hypothetical protein